MIMCCAISLIYLGLSVALLSSSAGSLHELPAQSREVHSHTLVRHTLYIYSYHYYTKQSVIRTGLRLYNYNSIEKSQYVYIFIESRYHSHFHHGDLV